MSPQLKKSAKPRILYVAPLWPHGRIFGGRLRALHIARALKHVGDVTMVVMSPDPPEPGAAETTAAEFDLQEPVQVELSPNGGADERLRWMFDTRFLKVHGCMAKKVDRERVLARMAQSDLTWLMNARTPNILHHWSWPRTVLDVDDVPSTYQRTIWQNGVRFGKKLKARARMWMLHRRELRWRERFSVLAVCSEADRNYLGGGPHIHVIPNGFEKQDRTPEPQPASPPRFGFIGLFAYPPNAEGMRWFLRECWEPIRRDIPDARLRLVGRGAENHLKVSAPGVDTLGWVENPAGEIATWSAMIVPVLHGAGTRIKLAEGFGRKCPIVSTRIGAFGYEVEDGRELMLADSAGDFAAACVSLARDPERGRAMAERAYAAYLEKWTWDAIAPRIWAAAEDALKQQRAIGENGAGTVKEKVCKSY